MRAILREAPKAGASLPTERWVPSSSLVTGVGLEDAPQVRLAEDDDMVQTLTADRTKQLLGVTILPGRFAARLLGSRMPSA